VKPEVPTPTTAPLSRRVIKRYSNRKLYDTKDSKYVTLLQIAEMVRGGEEVQIIDNNSKEDLTEVTLAQIIYEEEGEQPRVPLQRSKTDSRAWKSPVRSRKAPWLIPRRRKEKVEEVPKPTASKPGLSSAPKALQDWQMKIDERIRRCSLRHLGNSWKPRSNA
jgi:hypothetical protein